MYRCSLIAICALSFACRPRAPDQPTISPSFLTHWSDAHDTWVIGGVYSVFVSWHAECGFAKEDRHACNPVPFSMSVECHPECSYESRDGSLLISPLSIGSLSVTVKVQPLDGDSKPFRQTFPVKVVMFEELFLECFHPRYRNSRRCDDEGVLASRPEVSVWMKYDHSDVPLVRGTINGRNLPYPHPEVSLADLFPAARTAGGGVAPGKYVVRVEFGDYARSVEIEAH